MLCFSHESLINNIMKSIIEMESMNINSVSGMNNVMISLATGGFDASVLKKS